MAAVATDSLRQLVVNEVTNQAEPLGARKEGDQTLSNNAQEGPWDRILLVLFDDPHLAKQHTGAALHDANRDWERTLFV